MNLNKGLSALPILREEGNDYVAGFFCASFVCAEDNTSVHVRLQLEEDTIAERIATGEASYLVHIECPLTSYREKYLLGAADSIDIPLPLQDLGGDVEISTYIVATKTIENFTSPGLHPDYAGLALQYPKGSLLAIGSNETYTIERGGSGATTLPELFPICDDLPPAGKQSYWVELTYDTIKIHVQPHVKAFYADHPAQKYLTNQILVLPAAIEALTDVAIDNDHGEESPYVNATWYRIFDHTLRLSGITMTDLTMEPGRTATAAQVAQKLFRQPVNAAIDAIAALVDHAQD